jgi:outer membrane protein TolC
VNGVGGTAGSVPLPIDNTGPETFTLAQTINAATESSSDLQVAARNVEIDRKRADEAAAAARPNLRANASATRYDQATKIAIGDSPPIEVQKNHSELLSINLADSLDIMGQIRAASDQAKLQSLADQFTYDQIRNGRILRSQTIYFNLLRAQHQVRVAQQNLKAAQQQLTDAQNLFAGQVGQKIDVYRAATQVATAQQQLLTAQNNEDVARVSFNDLVGRPLTARSDVVDVPGANVGEDVTGTTSVGAGAPPAFTPFAVAPESISGIDIDQSLATALTHRPEVLASEVNVRVAQKGIKLARAGQEPTLSLDAAGDYFPTTSFQTPRQRTAEITANVSVPLYDGGATRDKIDEARLRTQNAQTVSESTRSDVSLDVRQAYLGLRTAAGQIDAANTALQQAVAARRLAQIRYEGQVGTYLEVTDAQAALVQAENSQVNAVYDYLIARAQFENALGTPETE